MSDPLVRMLGPITIRQGRGAPVAPARLDRVVLAHLALAEGRAVSTTELVDAVWGAEVPDGARNALQVKVSRLRRHLGPRRDALRHDQGSYRLDLPASEVDLRLFGELAGAAAEALADGSADDALTAAERALALWQGPPLGELDDHPRLVAARSRAAEQRAALVEVAAEAMLATESRGPRAVDLLRGLLAEDPLRTRARLLLMRALDRAGRRAEALAVYDVGRRVLAEHTGLAVPEELQQEFDRLLAAERTATRRERDHVRVHAVPAGAMDTARWLASEGAVEAALELALRGSWWWWLGGRRSEGRDLLEELVGVTSSRSADGPAVLGATAWRAVFDSATACAEEAIAAGERALEEMRDVGWGRHESVAGVLLAERLLQRGEPGRAALLLAGSRAGFARTQDRWGLALVGLTEAKAELQRGQVARAAAGGRSSQRAFEELDDAAGQMMAMDLLGYCAEIVGDLPTAARTHQRALALARDVDAPEWQATQLTRLGSVQALLGAEPTLGTLRSAVELARSIGSAAGVALAQNSLGLARGLGGDHDRAAELHAGTLDWYEQQRSSAGISYTTGRLASELAATVGDEAVRLANRSVELAHRTGDPRAVAHGLEALALTRADAPTRARALGGARALRRRTRSPLPPVVARSLGQAQRQLADELGDELLPRMREGAREVATAPG
ncbi:AfsR/SARP family transcriptional regulator [Nocardioides caldifontis]|uniref:AfsR/SARP family transcriptional regulator n=1 Tax=Nocardioides caldifontis TaxID=2588938 RepID=UPI0011DF9E16|nr:BTAD domain-containing putative transcriptional regulator [Nocardioides caldifontis]